MKNWCTLADEHIRAANRMKGREAMMDYVLSAILGVGFVYVLMLATNPKDSWTCPVQRFFARKFGSWRAHRS